MSVVDLNVIRSLLDSQFDGYRLSLDPLPIYRKPLPCELQAFSLSDIQTSVLESRAFFNYSNQLFSDPCSENKLYFINNNSIFFTGISTDKSPLSGIEVGTPTRIISFDSQGICPALPPNLSFPSPDLVIYADGAHSLRLLHTPNTNSTRSTAWTESGKFALLMPHSSACTSNGHRLKPTSPQVVSASAPDCTCAFVNGLTILHSISRTEPASSSLLLDVLLLHIEETGQYFTTGCQTPGSVGGIADESKIDPSDDRVFCPPKRFAGIGSQKDVPSERTAPSHCALLEWLTFAAPAANGPWTVRRQRRLAGFSVPDSAAIDSSGSHLYVCSERPFRFSFDSQRAAANTAAAVGAAGSSEAKPASEASPSPAAPEQPAAPFKWRWIQSEDELHVTVEPSAGTSASSVTVPAPEQPPAITKAAVECSIGPDAVSLAIGGTRVFGAEDQLFARIDSSQSTWLISDQKLEIMLSKIAPERWPSLFVHNAQPEQAPPELLAHLTSDKWNPAPENIQAEGAGCSANQQQLEECDLCDDADAYRTLVRFDGDTLVPTHTAHVGSHQFLFANLTHESRLPAICMRHDVDGLLWIPLEESDVSAASTARPQRPLAPWRHVGTLNAFGYVSASKSERRFMACAPDLSYAAIADCTRHVYVYRSQVGVDPSSELRHRKSGRGCATVSKQYVVTLEAEGSDASEPVTSAAMPHRSSRPENILGLHCADEFIFVLTAQHFYAIRVKF